MNYPVSFTEYTWITRMPGYIQRYQRIQTKNSLVEVEDGWETEDDVHYKKNIDLLPENRLKIAKISSLFILLFSINLYFLLSFPLLQYE